MFGVDRTFVCHHIPCAIGALVGFLDLAMGFDRRAPHAGRLGIGMCCARGVKVAIERIIKRSKDAIGIGDRRDFFDIIWTNDLGFQTHVTVLGPLGQKHVKAFLIIRQSDTAHMVKTTRHACDCFEFFVKFDGIALKRGHICIAV